MDRVDRIEEAIALRDGARLRHHDATHHVFACRIAEDVFRYDDDGEPTGTGGRPVLAAIDARGLHRTAVVVTRWFGGTELGTGGLSRAYRRAARAVLEEVEARRCRPARRVTIRYPYETTGAVMRAVDRAGASRLGETFAERARVELAVPVTSIPGLLRRVRDGTAGRASAKVEEAEVLIPVDRP